MKYIAVEGCELKCQAGNGNVLPLPGQTSTKVNFDGKSAYLTLNFTIVGYQGGTITDGNGTGAGSIIATSRCVKIEGQTALLEGDVSASITISGTAGGFPAPPTVDVVEITRAGQTKVQGE